MFKNLKKLRFKLKWFMAIAISLVVIFLFISSSLKIDVGNILFGIAAIGLTYILYRYLEHKKQPKKTLNISIKAKLIAPMLKINRYNFHIEVVHEILDKNQTHINKVEELDIKFKEKDHPDMYKWCFDYATDKIREHVNSAKIIYPEAIITSSPIPSIITIKS